MNESYKKVVKIKHSQNDEIQQPKEVVNQLKPKKTSNNSSVAPSKDENRVRKTSFRIIKIEEKELLSLANRLIKCQNYILIFLA